MHVRKCRLLDGDHIRVSEDGGDHAGDGRPDIVPGRVLFEVECAPDRPGHLAGIGGDQGGQALSEAVGKQAADLWLQR